MYVYLCTYKYEVTRKKGGNEAKNPMWEADRRARVPERKGIIAHPLAL